METFSIKHITNLYESDHDSSTTLCSFECNSTFHEISLIPWYIKVPCQKSQGTQYLQKQPHSQTDASLTSATTLSMVMVLTMDWSRSTTAHLQEKLPRSTTMTWAGESIFARCLNRPYQSLMNGGGAVCGPGGISVRIVQQYLSTLNLVFHRFSERREKT